MPRVGPRHFGAIAVQQLPGVFTDRLRNAVRNLGIDMRDLGYTEQQQYALLADTLGQPGMGALVAAGGGPADPVAQTLQLWEPVLAGAAQIASGNADTATQEEVYGLLDNLSATDDWSALVAVLRRIIDGERSTELLTGLDHRVDTAIATELLNRLQ